MDDGVMLAFGLGLIVGGLGGVVLAAADPARRPAARDRYG